MTKADKFKSPKYVQTHLPYSNCFIHIYDFRSILVRDVSHVLRSLCQEVTGPQNLQKFQDFRAKTKMKVKLKMKIRMKVKKGVVM